MVGVTFVEGYPGNLREAERAQMFEGVVPVALVREPGNPADPNAVEVHVLLHGRKVARKVGHVPAPLAARMAPELDAGTVWLGEVEDVYGASMERPGLKVRVRRVQLPEHSDAREQ